MSDLFDNLSDADSEELYYYDSDDENPLYDYESSSEDIPSDDEEEDPFGGPDLEDLEPPIVPSFVPIPTPSLTGSPASSSTSLPLSIRPLISQTSSVLTIQAFEALTLTE